MDINERIEKLKQRNDFFYDEDIALCIKSLETLQEIKKTINIDNSYIQEDVMKYKIICNIVDKALEEEMREATKEESDSINNYIKSISISMEDSKIR